MNLQRTKSCAVNALEVFYVAVEAKDEQQVLDALKASNLNVLQISNENSSELASDVETELNFDSEDDSEQKDSPGSAKTSKDMAEDSKACFTKH